MLFLLILYLILIQESLLQMMRVQEKGDRIDQFFNLRLNSLVWQEGNKTKQNKLKPDHFATEQTSIEKAEWEPGKNLAFSHTVKTVTI